MEPRARTRAGYHRRHGRRLSVDQALERARALRLRNGRAGDLLTSEYSVHLLGHVYHWLPPLAARWLREFAREHPPGGPGAWDEDAERSCLHVLRERLSRRGIEVERKWPHLSRLSRERGSFVD